jgi:hypothetical protein
MQRRLAYLLAFLFLPLVSLAQKSIKDSFISVPMLGVQMAVQLPGGDMADRFGINGTAGASLYFKTKTNWLFGAEFNFLFGGNVKEDPLLPIETRDSFLIGSNGLPQLVRYYERGYSPMLRAGKIFPGIGPNKNSGLMLKAGVGFIQHKIKYYWNSGEPPQLQGDYIKGYDRLTNGLSISEAAGYLHLSNKNYLNFSAEIEMIQAFTRNRRSWNFDTHEEDTGNRLDLFFGLRITWLVPMYGRSSEQVYY